MPYLYANVRVRVRHDDVQDGKLQAVDLLAKAVAEMCIEYEDVDEQGIEIEEASR